MLSAGGTGGHLFPAQALAGELVRRGRDIVVMTDARFANYATAFPGARIETVPSVRRLNADRARRSRSRPASSSAFAKLLRLKPAAVVGFGGYPSRAGDAGGLAWRACPPRIIEQNAVVGRANRLVMNQVRAGGRGLSHRPLRAQRYVQDRADRQSAAPRSRCAVGRAL